MDVEAIQRSAEIDADSSPLFKPSSPIATMMALAGRRVGR
jgi:hypothetical protein